jgi:peptidoglycan/xylan/chitin deacetylase (PgdA/CDA1 family)
MDGVVTLTLAGLPEAKPALRALRGTCVRLTGPDDSRMRICAARRGWVRVHRAGEPTQRIPARTGVPAPGERTLIIRQADLMLAEGATGVQAACPKGCTTATPSVQVPRLVVRSCRARAPWLVHSAQEDIGKAVALTFDDGPGAETRKVLRILRRNHVPGTFFQLGRMIQQERRAPRRILRQGHVIGNHSYSHPVLGGGDLRELARTDTLMTRVTGFRPCLFRAPYGENPPSVVALAKSLRMVTVHWNVDPGDWRGLDAGQMVRTSLAQARPGSILVFHDGESHPQMVEGLPRLIHSLRSRGYRFLTVPEVLRLPIHYRR